MATRDLQTPGERVRAMSDAHGVLALIHALIDKDLISLDDIREAWDLAEQEFEMGLQENED